MIPSPTRISPKQYFNCFACSQDSDKPFSKINKGELQYVVCSPICTSIALTRLGIIGASDEHFHLKSPVNITVRQSPFQVFNSEKDPIRRSPGSTTLDTVGDDSDSDSHDPDGFKQIQKLGSKILNKKSPTPE